MPNTGNLNSLTDRMQANIEKNQQEIESLIRKQFDALSKSLGESSKNALDSTEAAILRQFTSLEQSVTSRCRILSVAFGKKCLQALVLTLCALTSVTLGGWGLLALAESKVTSLHQEITTLSERKEALEARNDQIRAEFKGLEPYHAEGGDYLLTPEGWEIVHGGKVDKQDAWKIVRK